MIGVYHYLALAMFVGFATLEMASQSRLFPSVSNWKLKGASFALLYLAVGTYAPLLWDDWLGGHRLIAGESLPLWTQIGAGFLLLELGVYAWHRTMHNVQPLWRWFHQMHHSAERIDIWGAFYFHPFDMIGWTLLGSLALVLGIGVSVEAAIVINLLASFCSMFQHANIRTPQWLGYVVQRPESHRAHHERGVHARNYGDLPLFDLIFGTFHNPKIFEGEVGFFEGGSKRMLPMLIGKQIA
jgi:sterol desaturase/sphingolipid hydroxylase (fatty acid hydroxylase superfamily)